MKSQGNYMTRALRSSDRRYVPILEKLGYGRRDMQAVPASTRPEVTAIAALRAEYQRVIGKRPFPGWDAATLREKIAAAKAKG